MLNITNESRCISKTNEYDRKVTFIVHLYYLFTQCCIEFYKVYLILQMIYKFLGDQTFLFWVPGQNDMIRSDSKRNAKTNAVIRPQLRIKCLILNGHL